MKTHKRTFNIVKCEQICTCTLYHGAQLLNKHGFIFVLTLIIIIYKYYRGSSQSVQMTVQYFIKLNFQILFHK